MLEMKMIVEDNLNFIKRMHSDDSEIYKRYLKALFNKALAENKMRKKLKRNLIKEIFVASDVSYLIKFYGELDYSGADLKSEDYIGKKEIDGIVFEFYEYESKKEQVVNKVVKPTKSSVVDDFENLDKNKKEKTIEMVMTIESVKPTLEESEMGFFAVQNKDNTFTFFKNEKKATNPLNSRFK